MIKARLSAFAVLLLVLLILVSCVQPSGSAKLDARIWTDNNVYGINSSPVIIHFSVNKPAKLTLTNAIATGGTVTYFSNVLYNAGESSYTEPADSPTGTRTVTLTAVSTSETFSVSTTYTISSNVVIPQR